MSAELDLEALRREARGPNGLTRRQQIIADVVGAFVRYGSLTCGESVDDRGTPCNAPAVALTAQARPGSVCEKHIMVRALDPIFKGTSRVINMLDSDHAHGWDDPATVAALLAELSAYREFEEAVGLALGAPPVKTYVDGRPVLLRPSKAELLDLLATLTAQREGN